jgi:hypothetical protein
VDAHIQLAEATLTVFSLGHLGKSLQMCPVTQYLFGAHSAVMAVLEHKQLEPTMGLVSRTLHVAGFAVS